MQAPRAAVTQSLPRWGPGARGVGAALHWWVGASARILQLGRGLHLVDPVLPQYGRQ